MTLKKKYVRTDGWRGYYAPDPPEGWEVLADCQVVNAAGEQCRDIIGKWLRTQKVHYRSGYLQTSNVFSSNMYIIIESSDKINAKLRERIDHWFVDTTTSTFSIMTGESWELDVAAAQREFDAVIAGTDKLSRAADAMDAMVKLLNGYEGK